MDKIVLKTSATPEDMWNSVVDALYGTDNYDNEVLRRLFTALNYHNEMERGLHEGFIENTLETIQNEGFDPFIGELTDALEYVGAVDYITHVRTHLPHLYHLSFQYQGALETGSEIEINETEFLNAAARADEDYQNLKTNLEEKITNVISEKKHYIFE